MRKRSLRTVGFALVVVGAAVLVAPSLGFQTLEADRSVSVHTADHPDAQLGLESTYDETEIVYDPGGWFTDPQETTATVANVTNRLGHAVTPTVEVEAVEWNGNAGPVLEVANQDAFVDPMASGESRPVILACSRDVGGETNDGVVELGINAAGDPVSVTGATLQIENVEFDCEGSDAGDGEPPEDPIPISNETVPLSISEQPSAERGILVESAVSFGLSNDGGEPVTVTGIQIPDSSAGSRVQRGTAEVSITAADDGSLDTANGISIGSNAPRYDFNQDGTIDPDQSATVNIGQFRTGDSLFDQVDMNGQTVTVVLMIDGLDHETREGPVPVEMELNVAG